MKILLVSEVARVLGISAAGVRWLVATGKLPCLITNNGTRLFDESVVNEMALERANSKSQSTRAA